VQLTKLSPHKFVVAKLLTAPFNSGGALSLATCREAVIVEPGINIDKW